MSSSKKNRKSKLPRSSSSGKTASAKPGGAVNAIEVQSTEIVTRECERVLRNIFRDPALGFDKEFPQQKMVKCGLVGAGAKIAVTDKEKYTVLSVLEARSTLYWIGIQLEFFFIPTKDVYRLISASLVLFRGDANEPQKTPLIRAEWDWREQSGAFIHAQPHWHLYRSVLSEGAAQEELLPDEEAGERETILLDETSNVKEEEWKKASDFHFAMASTWHIDAANSPQIQINNPKNLTSWMSGCISYTIGQLRYLNK